MQNEKLSPKESKKGFFGANFKISKYLNKADSLLCEKRSSIIFLAIWSLFINLLLESTLRQSVFSALFLIIKSPIVFLLGTFIIFATFSSMYFFKRRSFVFGIVSFFWLAIGVVNFVLMCCFQRSTPFNISDLRIFRTTLDIVSNGYLNIFEVILIAIAILAFFAFLVFVFIKCKKSCGISATSSFFSVQIWAFAIIFIALYTNIAVNADRFDNLPNKYREHGFAFCFLYSLVDTGIDKPDNYSPKIYSETRDKANKVTDEEGEISISKTYDKELLDGVYAKTLSSYADMPNHKYMNESPEEAKSAISRLKELYEKNALQASATVSQDGEKIGNETFSSEFDKPNIIFLQLESFYDVNNIMGYEYSEEPIPIYSMLKENLPGGKLTVPSIGAGTANTEFEILTGMDVSFFGIAEYPYLSILQTQTCESMAYNAKEYGYTAHAIHNHEGNFYDRHKVFPNLGFDTFTSLENMTDTKKNPRNWCKDSSLISPILDALKSTDGKDLIYTISVQPHGKYPSQSVYEEMLAGESPKIEVSGNEENPENPGFTYYVNQLSEVDTFLGSLILELNALDEPTILVFYGDHLPSFSVQKYWNLKEGNCYQTDYMIWNNCGIDFSDAKDLSTFQLASYVFSKVGINSGDFNKLNRLYLEDDVDNYSDLRHIYQYAVFYDTNLKDPSSKITLPKYERCDTKFGIRSSSLSEICTVYGITYIKGENFNEFTKIIVNGNDVDTTLLDSETICTKASIKDESIILTQQLNGNVNFGHSINIMHYTSDMKVDDNNADEVLEKILPKETNDNSNDSIYDDATADFKDGNDEMKLIQDEIN